MTVMFPEFSDAVERFYRDDLRVPLSLWDHYGTRSISAGSSRPAGPRRAQWIATAIVAMAALETGLEEIALAAHGHRLGLTGRPMDKELEKVIEGRFQAPNSMKVRQFLLEAFGIDLKGSRLAGEATFTLKTKSSPRGGAGSGMERAGPDTWKDLAKLLDTAAYIRNAWAHADARKLARLPRDGEGELWVELASGSWSMQKPHAQTYLRVVVSVFNTVALLLALDIGVSGSCTFTSPNLMIPDR